MMNITKYTFLAFFLFSTFLTSVSMAVPVKKTPYNYMKTNMMHSNDRELINKTFQDYVDLWNKHEIQSWGNFFTEDTDFITWSGTWFKSNAVNVVEHQKAHNMLKQQGQNMTYELSLEKIDFVDPTTAVVHAIWFWPDFKTPKGIENRKGILTMLLIKKEGKWLIRTTQNTRL